MSAVLGTIAKWAIPVGLAVGGAQAAMYDGNF
jgi:prohibitin 1